MRLCDVVAPAVVIACLTVSSGCTTQSYEPPHDPVLRNSDLSVLYVPSDEHVYLEIARGPYRYPEFEVSVGGTMLAMIAGGSAGTWLGYQLAVASAPSGATVMIDPYTAAASILVGPLITGAVEAHRQGRARELAEPFNAAIHSWEQGQGLLLGQVQDQLASARQPGSVDVRVLDDQDDESTVVQELPNDQVLLLASVAAFTPAFEVLELKVVYALLDRTVDPDEPVYRNAVVVQSRVHAGALGGNPDDEIDTLVDRWLTNELAEVNADPRLESTMLIVARNEAIKRARDYRKTLRRQYLLFDDRDPEGALWLANGAAPFRDALSNGYAEAARLIEADLRGTAAPAGTRAKPPGYDQELDRVPHLDQGRRRIYRLDDGVLLSLDARSRMIIPSLQQ